jgi:hypothetical protein
LECETTHQRREVLGLTGVVCIELRRDQRSMQDVFICLNFIVTFQCLWRHGNTVKMVLSFAEIILEWPYQINALTKTLVQMETIFKMYAHNRNIIQAKTRWVCLILLFHNLYKLNLIWWWWKPFHSFAVSTRESVRLEDGSESFLGGLNQITFMLYNNWFRIYIQYLFNLFEIRSMLEFKKRKLILTIHRHPICCHVGQSFIYKMQKKLLTNSSWCDHGFKDKLWCP